MSVTLDFKIISAKMSRTEGGDDDYGWAIAATNAQMCFDEVKTPSDSLVELATIKKDNEDLEYNNADNYNHPWYSKTWSGVGINIPAETEFELDTYTDYLSWVGIAVESKNDDLEDCKVPIHYRRVSDMEVEFTEYEIKTD